MKLPPELRALLVNQLSAALAAAWHRQKDERPSGLGNRDGRDVRDRDHHEHHVRGDEDRASGGSYYT